ncbi:bacillithiol biosynthesis deacetylase BshB2 [Lederbergia wuyishanensis]|uniref:Bacillithiol biosynthesis deacetylase BshB2 n=1 Tax=Lederbergia wuyishanensis TaxID=1347903 RepID=A0ABU0D3L1_9BACI|nr:bacillithiol biosynthesis deacetylase BshB2 [Lederbergia wuyishanensis]MCJ8007840.1 bacillithiol biosynthesis deacetylase BshB2 [Lederbergia wuyishanensis]MDQ0342992.1 bacillithiol biosynthesis deacetylase BshB2 [Lederbergia wuyishanensis]
MEKERHVLVVFPHPDDEAFGVSGTISSYIKNGSPVTYACLTLGEMGRNLGNPPFATRESLPKIRKAELEAAAKSMGLTDLRMMGYRDKTLEFESDEKLANMVFELIEELNPSLVISFYPGYSVHPDHEATGRAVVRAVRRLPKESRPKLHCVAFSKNTEAEIGPADIHYDVSSAWEQKLGALKAHISQTAWMLADMEEKISANDPALLAHWHKERFWTYDWEKDKVL